MDTLIIKMLGAKWLSFIKAKTAPRWLVLFADLVVVSFAYFLLAMSDAFASGPSFEPLALLRNWAMVVVVYLILILLTKSYTSIIRLSVIEDLYRVFLVVFFSTLMLIVVNSIAMAWLHEELMRFWSIVIIGAIAFSSLVIERLLIKHIYSVISQVETSRKRVLVLGTSLDSLILANALKSEIGGKYTPVGLLAEKGTTHADSISGFKVYDYDEDSLVNTFVENHIHALIFSHDKVKLVGREYADFFIQNNLRILSLNRVEEFEAEENDKDKDANISTYVKEVQIEDLLGRDPIVLNNTLVRSSVRGSVVLITGACGSIGSEIVRQVASYKAKQIVLVDQAETPMHDLSIEMKASFPEADIVLYMGDVQNYERMEKAFATYRPRFVFHAAAYKHVPMMEINPSEAVLTNVMGTKNIADLALKYDVHKFVMVSTDKAVNPTNVMGCTKRLAEVYTQSLFFDAKQQGKNTQFITTRFGNVLGSNGSVIPLFRKQIAAGGPVTITHPDIIRYFMTIPEACSLVLEAGCMGKGGEIYVFDMGQPVKIYDLATRMISLAGLRPGVDIEIKEVGLRPGEKLYEELLNDKEKTLDSTDNEKIMVAKVRTYDFNTVCDNIDNIITFAAAGNIHDMIKNMKTFIPEYHSNMSEFEDIDREIKEEQEKKAQVPSTPDAEVYYS
ncbi:MAG: nucleoside-diphosphate sugar epimerase/dehydratase [Bacteroidales bacterium]|nr:nucleoside-diphosphate sugar epimerase/dehydratase [Bacteroidales bacterium]